MTNVVEFPDQGVPDEALDDERVNYIAHQLTCFMAGIDTMTEVTWPEIFRGALLATIFAGQTAGYEADEVEDAFHSMRIHDGDD